MFKRIGVGLLFVFAAVACLIPVAVGAGIVYALLHFVLKFW